MKAGLSKKIVGVLTFGGPKSGKLGQLSGYVDSSLTKPKVVRPEDAKAVTIAPACGERNPFEGSRFPLLDITPDKVQLVYSASTGDSIWLKRSEVEAQFQLGIADFSAMKQDQGLTVGLLHGDVPLFRKPDISSGRSNWPGNGSGGVYKFLRRYHDFIELGYGGWEGKPVESIGWIMIHDKDGLLQIWPWYYDDC